MAAEYPITLPSILAILIGILYLISVRIERLHLLLFRDLFNKQSPAPYQMSSARTVVLSLIYILVGLSGIFVSSSSAPILGWLMLAVAACLWIATVSKRGPPAIKLPPFSPSARNLLIILAGFWVAGVLAGISVLLLNLPGWTIYVSIFIGPLITALLARWLFR